MDERERMKGLWLGMVALVALGAAVPAVAADLPARTFSKAPAYGPPATTWSGFYLGGEGGGGWGRDRWEFQPPAAGTASPKVSGAVAGGVIGYNWQTPGNVVFGLEGNFDWADLKAATGCPSPASTCGSKLDSIYAGTGRIGYAWNTLLLYAKGGYAWTHDRQSAVTNATGDLAEKAGKDRNGWTVGVGLEYMFAPNLSGKLEYDYYDFGNKNTTLAAPAGAALETIDSKVQVHTVKAGVNYHFNWGGPVAGAQ